MCELRKTNEIRKLCSAHFAQAELIRQLKSLWKSLPSMASD